MATYYSFIRDTAGRRTAAAAYLRRETLHRFLFVSGAFAATSFSILVLSLNRDLLPDQEAADDAIRFVSWVLGILYAAEIAFSLARSYCLGDRAFLKKQLMRRPWVMAYTEGCYLTVSLSALEEYLSSHSWLEIHKRAQASRKRLQKSFRNNTGSLPVNVTRWLRMHPHWLGTEVFENALAELINDQKGIDGYET